MTDPIAEVWIVESMDSDGRSTIEGVYSTEHLAAESLTSIGAANHPVDGWVLGNLAFGIDRHEVVQPHAGLVMNIHTTLDPRRIAAELAQAMRPYLGAR